MLCAHGPLSPNKEPCEFIHPCFFSLSLPHTMLKLHDAALCRCATETAHEIYWPRVLPFDTRDVANRFCAISHLLRLPCNADLSCLWAIFKPWAPETYGGVGNFIINALHLSDLIPAYCRSSWSMLYTCTPPRQTRAPVTNPAINNLVGVTHGEIFLWIALRSMWEIISQVLFALRVTYGKVWEECRAGGMIFHKAKGWTESNAKGLGILENLSW